MSDEKNTRQTRHIADFDDRLGPISLRQLDRALAVVLVTFAVLVIVNTLREITGPTVYDFLRQIHYHFSRSLLLLSLIMFGIATYISIIRHADVTPYFRRGAYIFIGAMALQALIGGVMYLFMEARPYEEIHIIYGIATVAALPFFIYVERTAEKRPAMGSYMWGFAILAGIILRSISTGAA